MGVEHLESGDVHKAIENFVLAVCVAPGNMDYSVALANAAMLLRAPEDTVQVSFMPVTAMCAPQTTNPRVLEGLSEFAKGYSLAEQRQLSHELHEDSTDDEEDESPDILVDKIAIDHSNSNFSDDHIVDLLAHIRGTWWGTAS